MNKRDFGNTSESSAVEFLKEKGFTIVERNYHAGRSGEIDIIASKESLLLFVEVKARNSKAYGGAVQSVSTAKINRLKKSAKQYCSTHPLAISMSMRYDLIALDNNEITWIQDIIR
jgi:putative endonuclease